MSRHRNVRNMRYEDELASEEYGVSYDDLNNFAVSPGTEAMFTYNRAAPKDHTLSSFMEEPGPNEEEFDKDEDLLLECSDFKMPVLDDVNQAKLQSALENLEGILGDNCHQPTAVDALMKFNYDVEKALDEILSKGGRQTLTLEPQASTARKKDFDEEYISQPSDKLLAVFPNLHEKERQTIISDIASNALNCNAKSACSDKPLLRSKALRGQVPMEKFSLKALGGRAKAPSQSTVVIGSQVEDNQRALKTSLESCTNEEMLMDHTEVNNMALCNELPCDAITELPVVTTTQTSTRVTSHGAKQGNFSGLVNTPLCSILTCDPTKLDGPSTRGCLGSLATNQETSSLTNQSSASNILKSLANPDFTNLPLKPKPSLMKSSLSSFVTSNATSKATDQDATAMDTSNDVEASFSYIDTNGRGKAISSLSTGALPSSTTGFLSNPNGSVLLRTSKLTKQASVQGIKPAHQPGLLKSCLSDIASIHSNAPMASQMSTSLSSLVTAHATKSTKLPALMITPLSSMPVKHSGNSYVSSSSSDTKVSSRPVKNSSHNSLSSSKHLGAIPIFRSETSAILSSDSQAVESSSILGQTSLHSATKLFSYSTAANQATNSSVLSDLSTTPMEFLPGLAPSLNDLARIYKEASSDIDSSKNDTDVTFAKDFGDGSSNGKAVSLTQSRPDLCTVSSNLINDDAAGVRTISHNRSPLDRNWTDLTSSSDMTEDLSADSRDQKSRLPRRQNRKDVFSANHLLQTQISLSEMSLVSSLRKPGSKNALDSRANNTIMTKTQCGSHQETDPPYKSHSNNGIDAIVPSNVDARLFDNISMYPLSKGVQHGSLLTRRKLRKKRASAFGQALSLLYEPAQKVRRKKTLLDDPNGFSVPMVLDLREVVDARGGERINVFNFATPSQDDLVRSKQGNLVAKKKFQHRNNYAKRTVQIMA